jgi:hypothetical protein
MHIYVCMYNQLERCGKIMYVQGETKKIPCSSIQQSQS